MSKNDHNKTIEDLRETVAGHSRRMDGDRPPRQETAAIMAAQLLALEAGRIADAADNIATLLATGLGKGSPIVEALRDARPEPVPMRRARAIRIAPTAELAAELHRRGIEERPDSEDDRERERERERERVRAQMKEQERRP